MKHIVSSLFVSFYIISDALSLFVDFEFFSWFFFTNIAIYLCHSHYNFNVLRVGYGKVIQTVMQAEWLACFWCISNQDQVPGLPGHDDRYHFEIFSVSDHIIHSSLVVFAMFSALLFMRQMWFFLNFRFLTKLLF